MGVVTAPVCNPLYPCVSPNCTFAICLNFATLGLGKDSFDLGNRPMVIGEFVHNPVSHCLPPAGGYRRP